MATTTQKYKPEEHLIKIQGKDYLPVADRLIWFREEHPDWGIETEIVKIGDNFSLSKATVKDTKGNVIATAHKLETRQGFADFVEKSETGACGRALAMCGFGTQFALELDEGTKRVVDSPRESKSPQNASQSPTDTNTDTTTEKQLYLIEKLYKQHFIKDVAAKMLLKHKFGKEEVKNLTKKEASEWIDVLSKWDTSKEEEPTEEMTDKDLDSLFGEVNLDE